MFQHFYGRDRIWFKLPPGNTSPPSAAVFLYDEENLVFQVVMPLINLALITHLTLPDAAESHQFYGYYKVIYGFVR